MQPENRICFKSTQAVGSVASQHRASETRALSTAKLASNHDCQSVSFISSPHSFDHTSLIYLNFDFKPQSIFSSGQFSRCFFTAILHAFTVLLYSHIRA
jgi:hypothetical protein